MMWEYGLDQYVLGMGPYQQLDEFRQEQEVTRCRRSQRILAMRH